MPDHLYSVVLRFDSADQRARANARKFLQEFNHLDPRLIEKALGQGRLLLKRNAEHASALALQQRIRVEGATCIVEKQAERQPRSGETLQISGANQAASLHREIVCPKCKTRQARRSECRHCGVIFAKIRELPRPVPVQAETPAPPDSGKQAQDKKNGPKDIVNRHLPALRSLGVKLRQGQLALQQWSQKPLNALFNCTILFLTAVILDVFVLFLGKYLWFIYTSTTVGEHYMKVFPEATLTIELLLGRAPVILAWEVVLLVLIVNLLLALIAQFTHLSRLYLDSGGFILKLIWIIASALGTAWLLSLSEPLPPPAMAFLLTLLPTACLSGGCLNLARTLLPEMGVVLSEIGRAVRHRESFLIALKNIYHNWEQLKEMRKSTTSRLEGDADA